MGDKKGKRMCTGRNCMVTLLYPLYELEGSPGCSTYLTVFWVIPPTRLNYPVTAGASMFQIILAHFKA